MHELVVKKLDLLVVAEADVPGQWGPRPVRAGTAGDELAQALRRVRELDAGEHDVVDGRGRGWIPAGRIPACS